MTGQQLDCRIPEEIPNGEKIVRAIKTPYHYDEKKARLKHSAFVPAPGAADVSVVRTALGDDIAVQQARQVSRAAEYKGLAVTEAKNVRDVGSTLYDYRPDFCGHAHINHGIAVPPKGVPFDPQVKLALDERCKELVARCRFHADKLDSLVAWSGDPL